MSDLLEDPDRWLAHFKRFTTSVASTIIYGFRTTDPDIGYVGGLMKVGFAFSAKD